MLIVIASRRYSSTRTFEYAASRRIELVDFSISTNAVYRQRAINRKNLKLNFISAYVETDLSKDRYVSKNAKYSCFHTHTRAPR